MHTVTATVNIGQADYKRWCTQLFIASDRGIATVNGKVPAEYVSLQNWLETMKKKGLCWRGINGRWYITDAGMSIIINSENSTDNDEG